MPSLALVSTDPEFVGHDDLDLEPLRAALRERGIDVHVPSWRDSAVDWSRFDLAVMRSPWDYAEQLPQFLAWLDRASAVTHILNPAEVIRWNLDKRYLAELEERGVRVVESHFCATREDVVAALAAVGTERVVVKPTVSAGSRNTGLFDRSDPRASALAEHIIAIGKTAMIQPAIQSVSTVGERALVYFDGVFSHALVKGPILELGGEFLGGVYTESIEPAQASPEELALADLTMAAISAVLAARGVGDAVPLYARLDLVETNEGPALLEAELFEPSYFVHTAPASEARFASAVLARLAMLHAR
ncbi:MAG TPA: hypothetical protein VN619_02050 [Lacisediminihabitans sp.]|nr:hypothetical protein [Lacisediminihabitans sp.]HXD60689.1 hypothetical protein [Lacisediminihabitans sp.]